MSRFVESRRRPFLFLVSAVGSVAACFWQPDRAHAQSQVRIDPLAYLSTSAAEGVGQAATNAGIVAGESDNDLDKDRPVLWRSPSSVLDLGAANEEVLGEAYDLTRDGREVVGEFIYATSPTRRAIVWREDDGTRFLSTPDPSRDSSARAITPDGEFIVGYAWHTSANASRAVRWSRNGDRLFLGTIGFVAGSSEATDVTPDGATIVGNSVTDSGAFHAFRWTESAGMVDIGVFGPTSISSDGRVIAGVHFDGATNHAVVWRPETAMQTLPTSASSTSSVTRDISADGRTIVGYQIIGVTQACLWIDGQSFLLRDYLIGRYNLDLEDWPDLRVVEGISPDGRVLVGWGTFRGKSRGFRVTLPNLKPIADAGKNVVVEARNDSGVRVRLDGRKTRDPEDHALTYRWTAKRIRFDDPASTKPSATFPVGRTVVTLQATDELGAKDTDTVVVTVRLKNSSARPHGVEADAAFAEAAVTAESAYRGKAKTAAAGGLAYVTAADSLGDWISVLEPLGLEATMPYAELRRLQSEYGFAAATTLAQATTETGDAELFEAAASSYRGALLALSDLVAQ